MAFSPLQRTISTSISRFLTSIASSYSLKRTPQCLLLLLIHRTTTFSRSQSTLPNRPDIFSFPTSTPNTHLLTLLPTNPPAPTLSLGTTTSIPPTTTTFTPNPHFLPILHSLLAQYSHLDPAVQIQATTLSSTAGFPLSKQKPFPSSSSSTTTTTIIGGGWIHVSDQRNPPDWGRISDVEDIFGSVEVSIFSNGDAKIREGSYQSCLGYRIVTRNGILQLSPFLRDKLVERLRDEEKRLQFGSAQVPSAE